MRYVARQVAGEWVVLDRESGTWEVFPSREIAEDRAAVLNLLDRLDL